jgi:hypothetical protein
VALNESLKVRRRCGGVGRGELARRHMEGRFRAARHCHCPHRPHPSPSPTHLPPHPPPHAQESEAKRDKTVAALKEGWAAELRRQKEAWAAAERTKREAWAESKTAEIKELTIKVRRAGRWKPRLPQSPRPPAGRISDESVRVGLAHRSRQPPAQPRPHPCPPLSPPQRPQPWSALSHPPPPPSSHPGCRVWRWRCRS